MLSLLLTSFLSFAINRPDVIYKNNQALKNVENKDSVKAKEELLSAIESDPKVAELYLNLGVTELAGQDLAKAKEVSQLTLKLTEDPKIKAMALYNLGLIAQLEKNKDEALKFYQQSLELNPHNKSAHLNIELLTQKKDGGGGGEGDQDKQNEDSKDDPNKEFKKASRGKAPKPQFNSQDLTPGDVNKIMEELKRQEKKVRAEFQKGQTKESPREKDW